MTEDQWIDAVAKIIVAEMGWDYDHAYSEASQDAEEWDFEKENPPSPEEAAKAIIADFRKMQACRIDPEASQEIMLNLINIQTKHRVKVLFAIESGSRAWGFPSPDSDYDVRFVYVRPQDWYLSIEPGRDVIELPIEGDMDINGWDLKKALGLLLKPNPVLLEWLSSPVRYIWNDGACAKLQALAEKTTHGRACLNHYLSLGERQWNVYVDGKDQVNLKKYFYIVRPAMATRWLRMNPEIAPPMNFFDLKEGIDLPAGLSDQLDDLLEKKGRSKELGEAARIAEVDDFIMSEFTWAKEAAKGPKEQKPDLREEADALFRELVKGMAT